MSRKRSYSPSVQIEMLLELKAQKGAGLLHKTERKELRKIHRIELVKRTLLMRIAAAWLITVPVTAMIAAGLFFMIRGIMLP